MLVYDAGMVLFGLATATSTGLTGAIFEAFNQIIVVLLLFVCLGLLERPDGRPANVVRRDLRPTLTLHASRLAFVHPMTGAPIDLNSALPDDLAAALAAARE